MESGRVAGTSAQQGAHNVEPDSWRQLLATMIKHWALQLQQVVAAQHHLKQSPQAKDPHQYHSPAPSWMLLHPAWPAQGEQEDQVAERQLPMNWR